VAAFIVRAHVPISTSARLSELAAVLPFTDCVRQEKNSIDRAEVPLVGSRQPFQRPAARRLELLLSRFRYE
jgi:hypothetical protein